MLFLHKLHTLIPVKRDIWQPYPNYKNNHGLEIVFNTNHRSDLFTFMPRERSEPTKHRYKAGGMSEHGAALQTYNQELVKCLEDLKVKRFEIQDIIGKEEADKLVLEKNIKSLQEKLNIINTKLQQHNELRDSYDKAIEDTEMGFKKILESSQTLLNLAQHEANKLDTASSKGGNTVRRITNEGITNLRFYN